MGNYDKYFEYKIDKLPNLSAMNKSELTDRLKSLYESSEENYKKYIIWDIELLDLADDFVLTKEHRTGLVDAYIYQDGRKYPNFDNFEEERIDFYKSSLELKYSDDIITRIYNYLIEKAKDGYLYVEKANEIMYRLTKISYTDQRHFFPRIIDLCIKYNHIGDLYKKKIVDLKMGFNNEIDMSSPFASFYLALYEISVFVKKDVLDTDEEIKSIIQKGIESVDDYSTVNAYGSELLLSTALIMSRELKNRELAESVILKSISHLVFVGDKAFASENYYKAVEYYEKAAHFSNQEGFLSRMNYIMAQIKECYNKIGKSIKETNVDIPVPNAKEMEESLSILISGKPDIDFHAVCAVLIANVIDDDKTLFPSMSDSRDRALKRYQANPILQFTAVSKMSEDRKIAEGKKEEDTVELFTYEDYVTHIKLWSSLWMESIFVKLVDEGLDSEQVSNQMCVSSWLSDTNRYLIKEAIRLLFEDRYAGFMHIAIPTYESIFKRLFGFHDISTTVLSMQDNSQKERIFGEFLSMEIVKDKIPKCLLELTKVIFTEQLGLNLRNNIAHGLCDIRDFDKNDAYLVFAMLILITTFDWINYQQKREQKVEHV